MARALKCIIPSLLVISAISFAVVYLTHHHHQPCKLGECVVKVAEGFVKGRERKSALTGKKFYSFQGIPYAKPPVGQLRFKDPQPIGHWFGVHDSTREGNVCAQLGKGSEDCLFLNIYTTQFPDDDVRPFPVIVWIHGGGFLYGSGNEQYFGGDYLIEHDVVVITLNYRLGVFGFLSLGNEDVPGNAGLKDQVLALKWVKNNIFNFGGDPNNITLFGQSAGAASAHYHTLAPMSEGLFQTVILQSGSALNQWAFQDDCTDRAQTLGHMLGINASKPEALAQYLRGVPVSDLVNMQHHLKTPEDLNRCVSFPFTPCVEAEIENDTGNHFLLDHPKVLMESGNFTHVPAIIGIVSNEGTIGLGAPSFTAQGDLKESKKHSIEEFKELVPYDLRQIVQSSELETIENRVREFYFQNKSIDLNNLENYINLCGDLEILIGIQQTIDYLLRNSTMPVYLYTFTFDGKYNFMKHHTAENFISHALPTGPHHGDEIGYLFHQANRKNVFDAHSYEVKTINHITKMWTNFAETKDPNGFHENEYWEGTEIGHPKYLEIGELLKMTGTNLVSERTEFWENIYLLYS